MVMIPERTRGDVGISDRRAAEKDRIAIQVPLGKAAAYAAHGDKTGGIGSCSSGGAPLTYSIAIPASSAIRRKASISV